MAYRLALKAQILVFNHDTRMLDYKTATINFKCDRDSELIVLLKNMAVYAAEPLEVTITREEGEADD